MLRRKSSKKSKGGRRKGSTDLTVYDKFNLPLRFMSNINQTSRESRGWLRFGQDLGLY
jgi:hypothetical protein